MKDLIERQAAIDAMAELQGRASTKAELKGISKAWKWIKKLPSAQPDIIHCKDCKHWRDGIGFYYCDKLYGMGVLNMYDYMKTEDEYCSMAERRTDG